MLTGTSTSSSSTSWILLPHKTRRLQWDIFVLVMVMYVAFISIFVISFLPNIGPSSVFFWIERFLDVVFLCDIVVNFLTAYKVGVSIEDETYVKDGAYVTNPGDIAKRYLSTWFVVDFFSTVPWGVIVLSLSNRRARAVVALARLLRLLRLSKIPRIIHVLRRTKQFTKFEVRFGFQYGYGQLAGLAFAITLLGHWVACLFFFFGYLSDGTTEIASWINEAPPGLYGQYIWSLYFSVYTFTTIGYGDVVPRTALERTYVTVIMVIGAACFGYSISKLSDVVGELAARGRGEREMLDRLATFGARRQLPEELQIEMRRNLHDHYYIQDLIDERAVLDKLSKGLKLRVLRKIYGPALTRCPAFSEITHGESDEDALKQLDALYPEVKEIQLVDMGAEIFRRGDEVDGFYVVHRGNVVLEFGEGKEDEARRKGESFGYSNLTDGCTRDYTARCDDYALLLFVPVEAVSKLLASHPGLITKKSDRYCAGSETTSVTEQRDSLRRKWLQLRDLEQRLRSVSEEMKAVIGPDQFQNEI